MNGVDFTFVIFLFIARVRAFIGDMWKVSIQGVRHAEAKIYYEIKINN